MFIPNSAILSLRKFEQSEELPKACRRNSELFRREMLSKLFGNGKISTKSLIRKEDQGVEQNQQMEVDDDLTCTEEATRENCEMNERLGTKTF